jgi:hypothetical protein
MDGGTCTVSQSGPEWLLTCPLPELAAGQSMVVKVGVRVHGITCPSSSSVPWSMGISSLWRDPELSDNTSTNRSIGCNPG